MPKSKAPSRSETPRKHATAGYSPLATSEGRAEGRIITNEEMSNLGDPPQEASNLGGPPKGFQQASFEMERSPYYAELQQRDEDANWAWADKVAYRMENTIAANPNVPFKIMTYMAIFFSVFYGFLWTKLVTPDQEDGMHQNTADIGGAVFMAMQVLVTGGYMDTITGLDERILFFTMLLTGILFLSVLIGLVNDAVIGYMESLTTGTSKVIEKNHSEFYYAYLLQTLLKLIHRQAI